MDREKVIKGLECCLTKPEQNCEECPYEGDGEGGWPCKSPEMKADALELLKEQEKKQITLHKKHVITWGRNDTFSMRNLYEAICKELLDEGELFIARTDDHEKVDFVFYVAEGRRADGAVKQKKGGCNGCTYKGGEDCPLNYMTDGNFFCPNGTLE